MFPKLLKLLSKFILSLFWEFPSFTCKEIALALSILVFSKRTLTSSSTILGFHSFHSNLTPIIPWETLTKWHPPAITNLLATFTNLNKNRALPPLRGCYKQDLNLKVLYAVATRTSLGWNPQVTNRLGIERDCLVLSVGKKLSV